MKTKHQKNTIEGSSPSREATLIASLCAVPGIALALALARQHLRAVSLSASASLS